MDAYLLPLTPRELLAVGDALFRLQDYEDPAAQRSALRKATELRNVEILPTAQQWLRHMGDGRPQG